MKYTTMSVLGSPTWDGTQQAGVRPLSKPAREGKQFDAVVFDMLKVDPEDFATQLTILDREVFLRIAAKELTSCGWNKKYKMTVAPNVVAFTRRFNYVSLWTVREVISGRTPKQRAELVGHFVQTARRLADLGNLHGACAIVSALQSAPVFRLGDTWGRVSRKERSALDRLACLFSERDNFGNLRSHTESLHGPCLPHLAPYLTDLLYLELAHPEERRAARLEAVASRVLRCQRTLASMKLTRIEHLLSYLTRVPYIEELQKFVEEENYKLSLELEPPVRRSSASLTENRPKRSSLSLVSSCLGSSPSPSSSGHKFVPGHRKAHSLGTNIFSSSSVSSASRESSVARTPEGSSGRLLIDDSVPEDGGHVVVDERPSSMEWSGYLPRSSSLEDLVLEDAIVCQGCLRRKTMLKDGKKPAVSSWARFWVALWGSTLIYYPPKLLRGHDRCDFKRSPCKRSCVVGWLVVEQSRDEAESSEGSFQLVDPSRGNHYKFRLQSRQRAREWCKWLSTATAPSKLPNNLMSFE